LEINQSSILEDGEKIYIPVKNQSNFQFPNKNNQAKININKASKAELEKLPGIGPTLAKRIFDYRAKQGLFKSIKDLLNVDGLGVRKLEQIAPYIKIE